MSSSIATASSSVLAGEATSAAPSADAAPPTNATASDSVAASGGGANSNAGSDTGNTSDGTASQSIRDSTSSKRPLMTHSKDGKLLSEKKLRRLEKNRLSARECRRRKREATENLEREINILEGENLRLRLQLRIGKEAEESMTQEQTKLTQDIDALLKSGASEADIHATLEEFKEKYADYGKSRRSAIEFHLRNIERLLMPTQTTSIVMTAIQGGGGATVVGGPGASDAKVAQKKSEETASRQGVDQEVSSPVSLSTASLSTEQSHSEGLGMIPPPASLVASASGSDSQQPNPNLDPKALFRYLVQYLGVTPQQSAALKDSRYVAKELDGCLEQALAVLAELRQRLAQTGEDLETEFDNIRKILTPTQAAKFLVWVANNKACMHMLNELWDRVYPAKQPPSMKNTTKRANDASEIAGDDQRSSSPE